MTDSRARHVLFFFVASSICVACGDDGNGGGGTAAPATYTFEREGESTVAYLGQSTRQVLIEDVVGLIQQISDDVLGGQNLDRYDTAEEVFAFLTPLYELGGAADPNRTIPNLVADGDTTLQSTYADLNDANLQSKLAGNDAVTDHADWNGGDFVGWESANLVVDAEGTLGAPQTPESLLLGLFWTFATQASSAATGSFPIHAGTPLYLTPDGLDLTQLVEKFLLGAVNFSQGTDDYLDDDVEGKGLLSVNELDEANVYTTLEHQWDEAYGYWGGARDYSEYSDEEIAAAGGRAAFSNGYHDTNGDGVIDLLSELNFSASVNAAKRDLGSTPDAPTDFSGDADRAFRTGRALITAAFEAGTPLDLPAVQANRDAAVLAWEKAYAATAIHYINEVLSDMDAIDGGDYSFADHAKHWSELKGFALAFQFNPRSSMSDDDFAALHQAIADAPVGASASEPVNDEAYRAQLLDARSRIGDAYDFDEANVTSW
ncbi:MAG: DUF4856 domain-containing protein [Deltaproteobacteria bacterium]|jgi:hypothetical protein|nr:DUF4856 domain-containing protein [Deltaproteobacteria bacterium]